MVSHTVENRAFQLKTPGLTRDPETDPAYALERTRTVFSAGSALPMPNPTQIPPSVDRFFPAPPSAWFARHSLSHYVTQRALRPYTRHVVLFSCKFCTTSLRAAMSFLTRPGANLLSSGFHAFYASATAIIMIMAGQVQVWLFHTCPFFCLAFLSHDRLSRQRLPSEPLAGFLQPQCKTINNASFEGTRRAGPDHDAHSRVRIVNRESSIDVIQPPRGTTQSKSLLSAQDLWLSMVLRFSWRPGPS
ncbi:hypothetical protein MSAN_01349100 [Mycena sanguinolenta]|uniref:Uncharacterized protein n=1 Tax=Mycena sanguinolenta TaxID=230812 RepID=A0A8H6YAP8_9AGAR|nr:hypothetical protein MSAN_01349100 [Mycena sanguinolenta]